MTKKIGLAAPRAGEPVTIGDQRVPFDVSSSCGCGFADPCPPFGNAAVTPAKATAAQDVAVGPSGLPLPRFVSLKSGRVNSRIGPGVNYPVDWLYLKSGLPMEITQEFDTWRRVRDSDGSEGWINQSLLSGKRTGIAAPWQRGKEAQIRLLDGPDQRSARHRRHRAGRRRQDQAVQRRVVRDEFRTATPDGSASRWSGAPIPANRSRTERVRDVR